VQVYVASVVSVRVIVLPETPVPDKVPPSPQLTPNVPVADILNWKVSFADKFVVVRLNVDSTHASPSWTYPASHDHRHVEVMAAPAHELCSGLLFAQALQVTPSPYVPYGQPQETLPFQVLALVPSYPVMYCDVLAGQDSTNWVLVNVLSHISAVVGEPFAINPAKVVGGIYPDILVQPENVLLNIPYAPVVIPLNNPAGIDVRPVQFLNVP